MTLIVRIRPIRKELQKAEMWRGAFLRAELHDDRDPAGTRQLDGSLSGRCVPRTHRQHVPAPQQRTKVVYPRLLPTLCISAWTPTASSPPSSPTAAVTSPMILAAARPRVLRLMMR